MSAWGAQNQECSSVRGHRQQQSEMPRWCVCCAAGAVASPVPQAAVSREAHRANTHVMVVVLIFSHFCYIQFTA